MVTGYSAQILIPSTEKLTKDNNNTISSNDFFTKKQLPKDIFDSVPSLSAPIEEHAAWCFKHIYSKPYLAEPPSSPGNIAREYHGMAHACRVALYIPVFVNLYRKYGDQAALNLNDEMVKVIQIIGLLHDAAREKDGKDEWDQESGNLVFLYLKALGFAEHICVMAAEAVANKDVNEDGYHQLTVKDGQFQWRVVAQRERNIFQDAVANGDCLDIIRARDSFNAKFLPFYRKFASADEGDAFEEMAELICEARSLITMHGDHGQLRDIKQKKIYEHEKGWQRIFETLDGARHAMLLKLYNHGKVMEPEILAKLSFVERVAYDPAKGLTEENVRAAMRVGTLFYRGMGLPTGISHKSMETLAVVEIKKWLRRIGVLKYKKHGSPDRSISTVGFGAGLFSSAGFIILRPNVANITSIGAMDTDTGFLKKKKFAAKRQVFSLDEIHKNLHALHVSVKRGGSSIRIFNYPSSHTELTYHMDGEDISAICFTDDPVFRNVLDRKDARPASEFSGFLQAVYLQKQYEIQIGKRLPIFKYSGLHNFIYRVSDEHLTDEHIVKVWVKACTHYFTTSFSTLEGINNLAKDSLTDIKVRVVYGITEKAEVLLAKKIAPCDDNYSPELKEKITRAIEQQKDILQRKNLFSRWLLAAALNQADFFKEKAEIDCEMDDAYDDYEPYNVITYMAIQNGCLDVVKTLASSKAAKQFLANSLHAAAMFNQKLIMEYLLEKHLDLDAKPFTGGETPLHLAVEKGSREIIQLLLDAGANPNVLNNNGYSPLWRAVCFGKREMACLLMDRGADITLVKPASTAAILLAIESKIATNIRKEMERIIKAAVKSDELPKYFQLSIFNLALIGCALNNSEEEMVKKNEVIRKLLKQWWMVNHNFTALTDSPDGINSFELANVLNQKYVEACRRLHSPEILTEGASFAYDFLEQLTAEDDVELIAENPALIKKILRYGYHYSIGHLIDIYFEKTGKPLNLNGKLFCIGGFLKLVDKLEQGKIVNLTKDALGRFLITAVSYTWGMEKKGKFFSTTVDLTNVNMSRNGFRNYDLSNVICWHFEATDEVTFIDCDMGDFRVTATSNLEKVYLFDPIFSNIETMERAANYFNDIPNFVLEPQHANSIKKMASQGKKIRLNQLTIPKLKIIAASKDVEFFQLILSLINAEDLHRLDDVLVNMIAEKTDIAFIEAVLEVYPRRFLEIRALRNAIDSSYVQAVHYFLGVDAANISFFLNHRLLFSTFSNLIDCKFKVCQSEEMQKYPWPSSSRIMMNRDLYILAEIFVKIFVKSDETLVKSETAQLFYQLLIEFAKACENLSTEKSIHLDLSNIKKQLSLLLTQTQVWQQFCEEDYTDLTGGSRFNANVNFYHKSLELQDQQLTLEDIKDICHFLRKHPEIKKINVSDSQITNAGVELLAQISTLRKLNLSYNDIDDQSIPSLIKSQLTAINLYKTNVSLKGIEMLVRYTDFRVEVNFKKVFAGYSSEEQANWEIMLDDEDPFIRSQHRRKAGLSLSVPSLKSLSLFKAKQLAENDEKFEKALRKVLKR